MNGWMYAAAGAGAAVICHFHPVYAIALAIVGAGWLIAKALEGKRRE